MAKQFDLQRLIFSLVVVRPREAFLEWLRQFAEKRRIKFEDIFFMEECSVWLIPGIGTFSDSQEFDNYITNLKPVIAEREFGRFGPSIAEIPSGWSAELCDKFFILDVRDSACIAP